MRIKYLMALSALVVLALVIPGIAQGMVTVVYPDGSTRTIPKTPYIETNVLYVGKYAMKGIVLEVVDPTVIHVDGIGYVKLADILVPPDKAEQAKNFLTSLLQGKTVYLDIDDRNIIDQSGRISAVVYLPINNTTVLNVNFDLVIKGYAYIFNEVNEFNPSQWKLEEKITAQTGQLQTTTSATTGAATVTTTTIITVTSVIPQPEQTTTTTQPTQTNPLPSSPQEGLVVIAPGGPGSTPPPNPPSTITATTRPRTVTATTVTHYPSTATRATVTVTETTAKTVTITVTATRTIQRYLTFTMTVEGELPFHATPLGISLIAALSALLGSLITIALLRKYIAT